MFVGILFAFCCAIIALMEACDLHPQFSVGRFHSYWLGVRHMETPEFYTLNVTLTNGQKLIQRYCKLGPIMIETE